jgi:glycosyltransferase involved in cell wall biosynthesis
LSSTAPAPEITVVVPTHRRPHLLARLVDALNAQTLAPERFEVVIVDDRSDDETTAVLAELVATARMRVLTTPTNRGPAAARNLGWRAARAPLVAFTDDDCVPEPSWLEVGLAALQHDPAVGVVQGCTLRPRGHHDYTRWTVFREVTEPSPWFEGCNLFFRRAALDGGGGFAEDIHLGGEDTAAGWGVLASGWHRAFAPGAVVRHDLAERGVGYHIKMGFKEHNLLRVAAEFPALRYEGFWRPWALRKLNVAFAAGVIGTVAMVWRRPAVLLWLPWVWMRKPPIGTRHWFRYLGERFAVDAAVFAGMKVGAVKYRQPVL